MFATPEWDDDSPRNIVKFAKKVKGKNTKNKSESTADNDQKSGENEIQTKKKSKKGKVSKLQGYSVFQIPEARGKPKGKQNNSSNNVASSKTLLKNENEVKPLKNHKKNKDAKKANQILHTDSAVGALVNKKNNALDKFNKIKKIMKSTPKESTANAESPENNKTNGHENNYKQKSDYKSSPQKAQVNGEKRKLEPNTQSPKAKKKKLSKEDVIDYSTDKPDELLLNMKKKKLTESLDIDTPEDLLFKERINPTKGNKKSKNKTPKVVVPMTKTEKRKEQLKQILKIDEKSHRNPIRTKGAELRQKMLEKLKSAQFRYLNEKLYTSSGMEAQQLFQSDPQAFQTYHEGYQQQIKKWPVNPLDVIVKRISKLPKSSLIADMGCGEAKLAQRLSSYKVRSFDLVSTSPVVEACDMARTPLLTASVDVAVYCLALMGTTLIQYLAEANRVLKNGGLLLIAEVESRFDDAEAFAKEVQKLGFKLVKLDKSQNVFFFMEFKKMQECGKKQKAHLNLKPCYYKKR